MKVILNMRVTRQRQLILQDLHGREDHPKAESIYESVRKRMPRISLATVYRNLGRLVDEGLVLELPGQGEGRRYDAATLPHHHFFCLRCGGIEDVRRELPSTLKQSFSRDIHGEVRRLRLQLFGICESCQREEARGAKL